MKKTTLLSVVALSSVFSFAQTAAPAEQPAVAGAPAPATATAPAPETAPATATASAEAQPATVESPAMAQPAVAESAAPAEAPKVEAAVPAENVAPAESPVATGNAVPAVSEADAPASAVATVPAETATPAPEAVLTELPAVAENVAQPASESVPAAEQPAVEAAAPAAAPAEAPVAEPAVAGTEIQGTIQGFLSADKSPYVVTGDLIVAPNTAVIIEPGTVLQFKQGTGITVNNGQLVIAGSQAKPVVLKAASNDAGAVGFWKGITVTGKELSEIRNADISGAVAAVAVENGTLNLQSSRVSATSSRGVYARNSKLSVRDCEFDNNQGVALHLDNYAEANVERSKFSKNNVAILNSELAETNIASSHFDGNEFGLMSLKNSLFQLSNTKVENNKVGASSEEVLDQDLLENVSNNQTNYNSNAVAIAANLPASPEIPGVERRPLVASDKIGVLAREESADSAKGGWNILGNVMLGGKYHYVQTRRNHGGTEIIGNDTISYKKHYKNTFQVPGFSGEAAAYVMMQSADGKTIEFNTDMTTDSWNHFSPNPVTLRYNDQYNNAVVGDMMKSEGDIYMAGMPLFGADYTLSLLRNNADEPLFQLNGFFGEAKRSMVPDERHPYVYKNYIEDGTAQAQRLAYGGSLKWAPVRRFDAKIGAIYANDEIHDPLFRDGASKNTNTIDPMVEAFTMYADGNWLFFPGDIELNGQIAVGRADTANVISQRAMGKAIDEVMAQYGMPLTSGSLLRELMQNRSKIGALSNEELSSLFENSNVPHVRSKMESELKNILDKLAARTKELKKEDEDDQDDGRVLGTNWGSQNFALGASLDWNFYKTSISGHIKYVGEDFYSAGSPDQLSDTREFGARLDQGITSFWNMSLTYQLNVENAAKGGATNLFGLGESTRWGLFPDKDSKWFDEHELDVDRTRYTQNAGTQQTFDIGSRTELTLGYNFEYKKQYRGLQLRGDYMLEDKVYEDPWFAPRSAFAKRMIPVAGGDSVEVDSLRWTEYNALQGESYLASKFQEKTYKHTWNAGVSVKALGSVFKVGGRWTIREDGSEFYKDSIVADKKWDFADTTWAKLGYYFNGSNYFEQVYPVSVTSSFDRVQNRLEVIPRFKNYNRDDMDESEITVSDEMEIPLMNKFMILSLGAEYRYMVTEWKENAENVTEEETDVLGDVKLRVNHSGHFYSEWNVGTALYYRPDNLSSQYKDLYCGINLNYVF